MQTFVLQSEAAPVREGSFNAPGASSICARISSWVTATPNKTAVADDGVHLTYADLEHRSGKLAARLREAGAAQDRCVGIFLERSAWFAVAALAVLKSGAAYIPIDPSTPADRVRFMLADADAVALLTRSGMAGNLVDGPWRVIEVNGTEETSAAPLLESNVELDAPAYVVYTSGSTGRPKGVEITHANLRNLIEWHQSAFAVTDRDRASQVAGLGFDAAGWEIWPYLTAGASVHVADETTRRSPEMLRDFLLAQRITIGYVPTILAEPLLRMAWPADTALRTLLTGGDKLHARPAPDLPFDLVNNYGPTECTVVATSGVVAPSHQSHAPPSIGRPIANTVVLILDDALRPVAGGETGELCIGGAQVGRAYRNLPELTEKQFVNYIAAAGETLRIYRTGDRARYLDNGEIEFLGRLDGQVKVRGYRIELGEITSQLNCCPGIEGSAVLLRETDEGGPDLVAHVVLAQNAQLSAEDVRGFLARYLPDYMIPAWFVPIPALPVTANGKLDEAALPAPTAENVLRQRVAPPEDSSQSNAFQDQIAAMVASLLGQPSIRGEENFFMIGGHSMMGVQLVARIRDTFGVKLTLRQLFKAPTIAALSSEVARLAKAV
jgi:amino acid adenylation domain-containing protein